MSETLHVRLLGQFSLTYGDEPISSIRTPLLQSLLAYLLLHRGVPQSRQHVAYVLWPEATESAARHNLRQSVHVLRQALPDADTFVATDASTLSWRSDNTPVDFDVVEFERFLTEASAAEQQGDAAVACAALEEAVALYGGDLLPSCYHDWITGPRDQLRARYLDALRRLARLLDAQRKYGAAIPHAHHLTELDPLDEVGYVQLMRLHALNSDPAGVRRTYQRCAEALRRELGIAPSPATRESYERVLHSVASGAPKWPHVSVGPAALVGRQREWEQLRSTWHRVSAGESHLVFVSGEAGIGKTFFAEHLLAWAGQQGFATARTRSYAAEGSLALSPVTDLLRSDPVRESLRRLPGIWLTETARLLPELLAERPDLLRPEPVTDYGQRQRLFEALARAVLGAPQPVLLLIDDVQWCDQETLEWLHFLLRFDPDQRLLVLATARAEDVLPDHPVTRWLAHVRNEGRATELTLDALNVDETGRLAAQVSNRKLDDESARRLYRETEGNPLFVVEMARAGLTDRMEQGTGQETGFPGPWLRSTSVQLPPRMHGVIAGRLGQLTPATRELAGLAATVGRSFTADILATASGTDAASVMRGLDELWQRRILRTDRHQQGVRASPVLTDDGLTAAATSYDFSHDKIRDVAYAELSPMKRRYWHARIAHALEEAYRTEPDSVSAQLAAHYEQAGETQRAIPLYQRAAEVAQRVYAHDEAIVLLKQGLRLLDQLPAKEHHGEQRLTLLVLLSLSLVATSGYGAPEVVDALSRAQMLNESLAKPSNPLILRALAIAHLYSGDFQRSQRFGQQLLHLAEAEHDPILRVEGNYALGVSLFWTGWFMPSRIHLENALAHYDPAHSRQHVIRYSQDPKVVCLSRLAVDLLCLGYPDRAGAVQDASVAQAREVGHPFSLAYALTWGAMLHGLMNDFAAAHESADAAVAVSRDHGLGLWPAWARVLHGWAQAAEGDPELGVTEIQHGDELMAQTGAYFLRPFVSALLAEQFAHLGQVDRGLKLLNAAIAMTEHTSGSWCQAELHRLHGTLLRTGGRGREAEAAYRRAIAVAQAQHAKWFELRATADLARLWKEQDRSTDARVLLIQVFGWFTEGFDTVDVEAAQALLTGISQA